MPDDYAPTALNLLLRPPRWRPATPEQLAQSDAAYYASDGRWQYMLMYDEAGAMIYCTRPGCDDIAFHIAAT